MNSSTRQPPFDRRSRTQNEIKRLIAERNNVLSQYYNIANHVDYHNAENIETLQELLQEFCQDMIDYIATGHFEIYRRIEEGCERRQEIVELTERIFHKIIDTTRAAVRFNDLYESSKKSGPDILQHFPKQLSELGENLAIRIELEDKVINTLLCPKPSRVIINY